MKNFKGTQGVWKVRYMNATNTDDGKCNIFVEAPEPKNQIGKIEILMDDFGEHSGYPREQKLADAKAIQMIPQMMELLSYIREGEDVDLNEIHTKACDILEQIEKQEKHVEQPKGNDWDYFGGAM